MMFSKLASIVIAIGSTTCCPSLFLSVQKTKSAPYQQMPQIEIVNEDPILTPIYMKNRFLGKPDSNSDMRRYAGNPEISKWSSTLLTFVHFSDIQFRDRDVTLGNREISHQLDWLIEQSFEYDPRLESKGRYVAEALFATVNKERDVRRGGDVPSFAIHTGDAIDSGMTSELEDFHRLIDSMEIPFYNVLGNHDVLVFGNLMPTRVPDSDTECASVASIGGGKLALLKSRPMTALLPNTLCVNARVRCPACNAGGPAPRLVAVGGNEEFITHASVRAHFMAEFEHPDEAPGVVRPAARSPWDTEHAAETTGDEASKRCVELVQPHSSPTKWRHGFEADDGSVEHRGYYAFKTQMQPLDGELDGRTMLSIVLDTEDLRYREAGVGGRIQKKQMEWLREVLSCVDRPADRNDLVFVFGHHALSAIQTDKKGDLERLLQDHRKNVIAYFFGHDHNHEICADEREGKEKGVCNDFWEVQTASLLEFPQEARRIKIKSAGKDMAFLEVVAFRERLANTTDDRARMIAVARTAAERDWCHSHPEARCTDDHQHVLRTDGDDTSARLWFKLPGTDTNDQVQHVTEP